MLGDAGLIAAVKVSVLDELFEYLVKRTHGTFEKFASSWLIRIAAIFFGALVIASPLPDELGLSMMGLTHLRMRYIMLVSLVINTVAIGFIIYLAR